MLGVLEGMGAFAVVEEVSGCGGEGEREWTGGWCVGEGVERVCVIYYVFSFPLAHKPFTPPPPPPPHKHRRRTTRRRSKTTPPLLTAAAAAEAAAPAG